jgi:phenylalanyl-tRNA synthetase beta chain
MSAVGANLREALALDDTLITLKLTPNRADCLSLLGVAREVAALTDTPLTPPPAAVPKDASGKRRRVRVQDAAACPRFASRTIEGIDPRAPTPAWMKERIERSGIRSISAVVDITNYVMLELGQPLHAYDDRLLDGDIVVRFANAGEKLTLLNGQVLDLTPDLLLVCDEKKPLGLAGIMGGEHSGISDTTTTVYLEGAFWSPAVVQGKMRRLGFVSDAGYRFERGVDFGGCGRAVDRAAELIVAICGGKSGPLDDVIGALPARDPVRLRTARVARLLGIDVPATTIADIFRRLGLPFTRTADGFVVTPPTVPLRSGDRGRSRRGGRAASRLRRDPLPHPRRTCSKCSPIPSARAARTRSSVSSAIATGRKWSPSRSSIRRGRPRCFRAGPRPKLRSRC